MGIRMVLGGREESGEQPDGAGSRRMSSTQSSIRAHQWYSHSTWASSPRGTSAAGTRHQRIRTPYRQRCHHQDGEQHHGGASTTRRNHRGPPVPTGPMLPGTRTIVDGLL
jgi:hypothetical protein